MRSTRISALFSFAAVLTLAQSAAFADKRYTLADLQSLETSESWGELVHHLDDIPPAKRDGQWEKIVEKATIGAINAVSVDHERYQALALVDDFTKRYPHLKKSEAFRAKRLEVGIAGFGDCYGRGYDPFSCTDRLLGFVKADAQNRDLAFRAGKMVRLNMAHNSAVPFFLMAVVNEKNSERCRDEDVALAVVSGLSLAPGDTRLPQAQEIADKWCFDALAEKLVEEMGRNAKGSYYFDNTCKLLKERGKLGTMQSKQCK